jgi:hypothetical protein
MAARSFLGLASVSIRAQPTKAVSATVEAATTYTQPTRRWSGPPFLVTSGSQKTHSATVPAAM